MAGWYIDQGIRYKSLPDVPSGLAGCGSEGHAVEFQDLLYIIKTDDQGYYICYTWDGSTWTSSTLLLTENDYVDSYPLLAVFENELHMILGTDHYAYDGSSWRSVSTLSEDIDPYDYKEIIVGDVSYSVGSGRYRLRSAIIINAFTNTNQCKTYIYQNRALPSSQTPSYSWRYFDCDLPGASSQSLQLSKGYLVTVIRGNTNYILLICADVDTQTICIYDLSQNTEPNSWHSLIWYYGSGNIPRLGTWTDLYDALFVPSGLYSSNSAKLCLFFSKDSGNVCFSNTHSPEEYYLPSYWIQDSIIQPGVVGSDLMIFDDELHTFGGVTSELSLEHRVLTEVSYNAIKNAWLKDPTLFGEGIPRRVVNAWIGDENGRPKKILTRRELGFKHFDIHPFASTSGSGFVCYNNEIHCIRGNHHYKWTPQGWTLVDDLPVNFISDNIAPGVPQPSAFIYKDEIHVIGNIPGEFPTDSGFAHYCWRDQEWIEQSKFSSSNYIISSTIFYPVVYKDDLYMIIMNSNEQQQTIYVLYKFIDYSHEWLKINNLPTVSNQVISFVCSCDDGIHVIFEVTQGSNHYKYNGTSWIEDVVCPGSWLNGSENGISINNVIHMVTAEMIGTNLHSFYHYTFENGSWSLFEDTGFTTSEQYPDQKLIAYTPTRVGLLYNFNEYGSLYLYIKITDFDFLPPTT